MFLVSLKATSLLGHPDFDVSWLGSADLHKPGLEKNMWAAADIYYQNSCQCRSPSVHLVFDLVAQNTLRRNAAGWKRDFQYAIFALEFAGRLVSKRGFDLQYASVFDRYAASTRNLLGMFRFNFNTKIGKDKKPIKIRPATQNTQRVEISIRNAMRRKRNGSGPLRFLKCFKKGSLRKCWKLPVSFNRLVSRFWGVSDKSGAFLFVPCSYEDAVAYVKV